MTTRAAVLASLLFRLAPLLSLVFAACDEEKPVHGGLEGETDTTDDANGDEASGEIGVASGSCWLSGVPSKVCPIQPRGSLPAECESGRVFESEDFVRGTGPCVPAFRDWDCPVGWQAVPGFVDEQGLEDVPEGMTQFFICEPPRNEVGCLEGQGLLPNGTACASLGSACPAAGEGWASEADLRARAPGYDGPIIYVSAHAGADGDGSRARPRPLRNAVTVAAPGSVLALAPGLYPEGVKLDRRVALLGACVEGTTIRSTQPFGLEEGVVSVTGGGEVLVRDLTIRGSRVGINITGSVPGAHQFRAIAIKKSKGTGIWLQSSQRIEADTVLVEESLPLDDGSYGFGIVVQRGGNLILQDAVLRRNRHAAVYADGGGTQVTASRLFIEETQPPSGVTYQTGGEGVAVRFGAVMRLQEAVLRRNGEAGVLVEGATFGATSLLVDSTQPRPDGTAGRGLIAWDQASVDVSSVIFRRNHGVGFVAYGAGTRVNASAMVIEETLPEVADKWGGRGLEIFEASTLTLNGALLRKNHEVALIAFDQGSNLRARKLLVEGTRPNAADLTAGWGVASALGASIALRDSAIRDSFDVGWLVEGSGSYAGTDRVVIRGTRVQASDGLFGDGIELQAGARLEGNDLTLLQNERCGLQIVDEGVSMSVRRALIGRNLIGTNLQSVDFDRQRLANGLRGETYLENVLDLGSATLPIPDPLEAIGAIFP